MIPALVVPGILGFHTAPGAAVGTTILSVGNAVTFGGLIAMLPGQEEMDRYAEGITEKTAQEGARGKENRG